MITVTDYIEYYTEVSERSCLYCFKAKIVLGKEDDGYCKFCNETGEISEELRKAYVPHSGSVVW